MGEKKDIRRSQLIELLKDTPTGISMNEIMEKQSVSKRTLESDLGYLRKEGYKIERKKDIIKIVCNSEVIEEYSYYRRSDIPTVQGVQIMEILYKSSVPLSVKEICGRIMSKKDINMQGSWKDVELKREYDRTYKRVKAAIDILIKEGRIIQENNSKYSTSLNMICEMKILDNDMISMYEKIITRCKGESYSEIANRIAAKLFDVLNVKLLYEDISKDHMMMAKNSIDVNDISSVMEKLFRSNYQKNCIMITHVTKSGRTVMTELAVAMLVFSCDNAKIYLLGENEKGKKTIIDIQTITAINNSSKDNPIYNSIEYEKIYQEMFKVSVGIAYEVEVHFDNVFAIKNKINELKKNRPYASIELREDELIYRDTIRGLYDFAKYLRRYGRACTVYKPRQLVEIMQQSSVRVLERYRQNEYC